MARRAAAALVAPSGRVRSPASVARRPTSCRLFAFSAPPGAERDRKLLPYRWDRYGLVRTRPFRDVRARTCAERCGALQAIERPPSWRSYGEERRAARRCSTERRLRAV